MKDLEQLPNALNREALSCRAIVETPAGSSMKFTYDPGTGLFQVGKVLPLGMAFPLAFGFVPSTSGGDGDPLDILVLDDGPLPVGCLVTVRLLGAIEAEQWRDGEEKTRNDRLIGRLVESQSYAQVESLVELGSSFTTGLISFFKTYKQLRGQHYDVLAVSGPARAVELIDACGRT